MTKTAFALLAGAVLTVSSAFAMDLSGELVATDGKYVDASGVSHPCSEFRISASQSPGSVDIHEGKFTCDALEMTWQSFSFDVRGNVLFYKGTQVGELTGDELHAVFVSAAYHTTETYDVKQIEQGYAFEYRFQYPNGGWTYAGTLQKKN